jgi:D-beta-D-heptose 7-phosphate kinase/D-beta-D-heptose 1-phosphate adenosyltransferase
MASTESFDSVASLVAAFGTRRVLVLGDAILDEYLYGDCSRISPEAPVPVLRVSRTRRVLGGAANTAANIASLGGRATLVSLVGHDDGGSTLARCAEDAGIDFCAVEHEGATVRKTRVIGQQQQIVRLDYEDVRAPVRAAEDAAIAACTSKIPDHDIVVISDYAKGCVSPRLTAAVLDAARAALRPVIVDPRPQHRDLYVGCDYITPNWRESRALLGWPDAEPSPDAIAEVAAALARELRTNVVLTLGPHGIRFCSRDGSEQFAVPTLAQEVFDVSGAGDTVVAAFALAIAAGAGHATAVRLANKAASVVVAKFGTATVTPEEVLEDAGPTRLVPRGRLGQLAATLRSRGKRVVTVNGSFDLLHAGHLHILNEARQQGDVLIVGLNSDASVKQYKGPTRPIVPDTQRAQMLLSLRVVDYVHIFDESDPTAFIAAVGPDVHVNGAEYGEHCVESEVVRRGGGRLHLVDRLPDLSTSGLVDALRRSSDG